MEIAYNLIILVLTLKKINCDNFFIILSNNYYIFFILNVIFYSLFFNN